MKKPIKKNKNKYKLYNESGLDRGNQLNTSNVDIYLTRDSYGQTPQINLNLPADHPVNVRNAIALQQGWIEVPITEIDIDVNKKWEKNIRLAAAKYGPNAKYIVDPNTREIIPESKFNQLKTNITFLNNSEAITDNNTKFEVLLALNHKDLQKRNPLNLAYTTLAAGAMTNPVTGIPLMYLGQTKYVYDGFNDAYNSFKNGNYGLGLLKAGTTTAFTLLPYGKALSTLKFAPKVGIPIAAGLTAADAYASNTEPHNFTSTLSPEQKAMIDNESTPWEQIGNDEELREYWNKLIEAELTAAHFNYQEGTDNLGLKSKVVWGNKGENIPEKKEETPWYLHPVARYGGPPLVIEGIPWLIKRLTDKNVPWKNIFRTIAWGGGYLYPNLAYDFNWWPFLNTSTETAPDGYDENLALYYLKLINAYLKLNSGQYNGYVNGSTFSPYQTYPKRKNYDWGVGAPFDKPDTNAIVLKTGRIMDTTNTDTDKSSDALTNIISNIQVPQENGL